MTFDASALTRDITLARLYLTLTTHGLSQCLQFGFWHHQHFCLRFLCNVGKVLCKGRNIRSAKPYCERIRRPMLPEVIVRKLGLANSTEDMHCTRSLPTAVECRVEELMSLLKLAPSTSELHVSRRQRPTDRYSSSGCVFGILGRRYSAYS